MTPDEIRAEIAANPQSEEVRGHLITEAVQNNMANEIPYEWTVRLTGTTPQYDDTEDLIADQYTLDAKDFTEPQWFHDTMLINAHESGAMSIAVRSTHQDARLQRSGITPLVKFDVPTGDKIIQLLTNVRGSFLQTREPTVEEFTEPTTGITFEETTEITAAGYRYPAGILTIPDHYNNENYYMNIDEDNIEKLLTGLTAMANSAETANLSQQEIRS